MQEQISLTNLRFLPVACFLWFMLTYIVSYSIAVYLGHVYPIWPTISDTGTLPPESCVFGLMLNIAAYLLGLVLYIRYLQIKFILQTYKGYYKLLNFMNILFFIIGMFGVFGFCMLANFQETNGFGLHMVGANLCYRVGTVPFFLHTVICYFIDKKRVTLNVIRTTICIVFVIIHISFQICATKALEQHKVRDVNETLLWGPDKPGYGYRLASTLSEWAGAIGQTLYILSMYYDFKTMGYKLNFSLMNSEKPYTNGYDLNETT